MLYKEVALLNTLGHKSKNFVTGKSAFKMMQMTFITKIYVQIYARARGTVRRINIVNSRC